MDSWLRTTVQGYYSASLQAYMRDSTITYANYDSSYAETIKSLDRKIYIPSRYEMGGGGNEGGTNFLDALKTYKNTTNANTARTTGNMCWLRTEFSSSSYPDRVRVVASGGGVTNSDFQQSSATGPRARPILSLATATPITRTEDGIVVG